MKSRSDPKAETAPLTLLSLKAESMDVSVGALHMHLESTDAGPCLTLPSLSAIRLDPAEYIIERQQHCYLDATATTYYLAQGGTISLAVSDTGQLLVCEMSSICARILPDSSLLVRSWQEGDRPANDSTSSTRHT